MGASAAGAAQAGELDTTPPPLGPGRGFREQGWGWGDGRMGEFAAWTLMWLVGGARGWGGQRGDHWEDEKRNLVSSSLGQSA